MKRWLVVTIVLLAGAVCGNPAQAQAPCTVESVRERGPVGKLASITARDGGATALIGRKLLWTFGDTLFTPKSVDGMNLRSNTAGWADPDAPLAVTESADASGAPNPFIPFTDDERTENGTKSAPRIALWPTSVIPTDLDVGIVFYLKLRVLPGVLNYEMIGTGLARFKVGDTTATRDRDLLFTVPDPLFGNASLIGTDVYVYGALQDDGAKGYAVAKVPLAQVSDRSAYRFWDGSQWSADIQQSKAVLMDIPGAVTVSYNAYLGRYLAVHSATLSNKIVMQVADKPEGKWRAPIELFTGKAPAEKAVDYAGIEHPELSTEGGRRIVVSYYQPQGGFKGQLWLVEVTFAPTCQP